MTERDQQRLVSHGLAVIRHAEEVTGNVAQTCRYFGISRQTFYGWLRRYEEKGLEGLRDKSCRLHHSPNATRAEGVGKIIYLRQNYHFGPDKIAMSLKRYHDIAISKSGVWRILDRLDLNRLPSSQRHKDLSETVETVREAAAGSPGPSRRQVHHPGRRTPANGSTSSPPSTTAPVSGRRASTRGATRRPPSSSSTTCSPIDSSTPPGPETRRPS